MLNSLGFVSDYFVCPSVGMSLIICQVSLGVGWSQYQPRNSVFLPCWCRVWPVMINDNKNQTLSPRLCSPANPVYFIHQGSCSSPHWPESQGWIWHPYCICILEHASLRIISSASTLNPVGLQSSVAMSILSIWHRSLVHQHDRETARKSFKESFWK